MEALGIFLAELIKNLPKLVALFDFILNLVQDNPDLQVALNEAIARPSLTTRVLTRRLPCWPGWPS